MSGKERDVLKLKDYIGESNYGTLCGLADAQGDSEFIGETFFFQRSFHSTRTDFFRFGRRESGGGKTWLMLAR
jgi:hypothetical protein